MAIGEQETVREYLFIVRIFGKALVDFDIELNCFSSESDENLVDSQNPENASPNKCVGRPLRKPYFSMPDSCEEENS